MANKVPLPTSSQFFYTQNPNYQQGQPSNSIGNAQYNYYQNLNGILTPLSRNPIGGDNSINDPTGITQLNPDNLPQGLAFSQPQGQLPQPTSSGITSSASMQNYQDQYSAVLNAFPSINNAQQSSIASTGAAQQQQISAQQAQGDQAFQQQIQQAQAAENTALGNADFTGAESNPNAASLALNSTYAGMKANISNQFQQTIGNLQDQQQIFDAQSAANSATAAAQTQANAISAANNMIQNQLTVMGNMVSLAQNSQNVQLQQETNSQNFQLGMANYQLQLQNNQQSHATGMMNTVLGSLAGTGAEGGWSALSPIQQNQMSTLAAQAGIPVSLVQSMIDQKKASQFTTATDAFGNATVLGLDCRKDGKHVLYRWWNVARDSYC